MNLSVYQWTKDIRGLYLSCNEEMAQAAGEISPYQMMGKHDTQLLWRDRAEMYLTDDQLALTNGCIKKYEYFKTTAGERKVFVTKIPLLNKRGKRIGTMGSSVDLTKQFIINKLGHFDDEGNLHFKYKGVSEHFTKYEIRVLKELLKGKSSREISDKIFKATRTVEGHILSIRHKLQCGNKGEIISKALELNLIYLAFDSNN